jgi:hypothetical protein
MFILLHELLDHFSSFTEGFLNSKINFHIIIVFSTLIFISKNKACFYIYPGLLPCFSADLYIYMSCGCCDQLLRTRGWGLKTTQISFLTVLENRITKSCITGPKSRDQQGCVPFRNSRRQPALPFWLLSCSIS